MFPIVILTFWTVAVNTTIDNFFMPGTQPDLTRSFDSPSNCSSCHRGISQQTTEPTFSWQGSMMSQAMRDPLYLASLTIANQDADFAGDLCLRCHTPSGWLSGRSEPTDGSALTSNDKEGVHCHFCHELINPKSTNANDLIILSALDAEGNLPLQSGNGMFVIDAVNDEKRGPYNDTEARHPVIFDSFYSESEYCATCHDVSNPAFTKSGDSYILNELGIKSPSFNTYDMFPVERTYSEWKMSAYNSPTGISGTAFGGNKTTVSTCQDCHMKDITGYGASGGKVPLRTDLPFHDMTGGNTFVPLLIKQLYASDANVNTTALDAGILRARGMLQNAASLDLQVIREIDGYEAYVKITNKTGHKLPSGYPEGRRMWINLTAYNNTGTIIYESGAYDSTTAILNKLDSDGNDSKIYEAKLGMSSNPGVESFHFALNNEILKDNRIPPQGFTNANFQLIQAAPVAYSYNDGAYFDTTEYNLPPETYRINVKLLYQTASKEYIEFLKDENTTNDAGDLLYNLWASNGKSLPEIMNEEDFYTETLSINDLNKIFNKQLVIYPNPAKNEVNLSYSLQFSGHLIIEVFDLNGKRIAILFNGYQTLLENNINWKTDYIASGLYIIKFTAGNKSTSSLVHIN